MSRVILAGALLAAGLALAGTAAFSQQGAIPDWIKSSAGWWADGMITDQDYITSLQWLVDNGYINIGGPSDEQRLVRESTYSIAQPKYWERQIPMIEPENGATRDSLVHSATMDMRIPAVISINVTPLEEGDTMEGYREWGLQLVKEYLGDAFNHTLIKETVVVGNPGYVDEYTVTAFGQVVYGRSYSFAYQGVVYEVKYEAGSEIYDQYLAEFERVAESFSLG